LKNCSIISTLPVKFPSRLETGRTKKRKFFLPVPHDCGGERSHKLPIWPRGTDGISVLSKASGLNKCVCLMYSYNECTYKNSKGQREGAVGGIAYRGGNDRTLHTSLFGVCSSSLSAGICCKFIEMIITTITKALSLLLQLFAFLVFLNKDTLQDKSMFNSKRATNNFISLFLRSIG
jgi:hypothetical protein